LHLTRLPIRIRDGAVHPAFLGEADHSWLSSLLEAALAQIGAPWCEFEAAMNRPVQEGVSLQRQAVAATVLGRMCRRRIDAALPPVQVRELVFAMAATGELREQVVASSALRLQLDPGAVEQALFADLPSERVVVAPRKCPDAAALAVEANLEMCRSLLMRAIEVDIQVGGPLEALIRRAQRHGLLWTVVGSQPEAACLRVSGPLRLFRRTTRYGHALGSLLPALAECPTFELFATLVLGDREVELRLRTGDPNLPVPRAVRGGRSVNLGRLLEGDDWIAVPDPQPIEVGARLLFPHLEMVSRHDSRRRWLIERIGFWTPEFIEETKSAYAEAGVSRVILCVDERMQCSEGDIPRGANVLAHRGRISVERLWQIMNA